MATIEEGSAVAQDTRLSQDSEAAMAQAAATPVSPSADDTESLNFGLTHSLYGNPRASVQVAVDPVALITNECITITSAMRKNARWAQSSVAAILGGGGSDSGLSTPTLGVPGGALTPRSGSLGRSASQRAASRDNRKDAEKPNDKEDEGRGTPPVDATLAGRWGLRGKRGKSIQDNPLIAAFSKLRRDLLVCKDIRVFDTPSLLHPFLQVVRSSSTSGPITSLALIAITKFFSYNLITPSSPRLPLAMQLLSSAITHCRFEASDSSQDEVVLLRILRLMEVMMYGPGSGVLGDESVCEMMETALSICCQMRLSEVLRRSAEMSMVTMCQVVFEKLKHLEVPSEDALGESADATEENNENLKVEPSVNGETAAATLNNIRPSAELDPEDATQDADNLQVKPYSLPSIRELFRVLVSLLDPHNKQHTDTLRVMAMRILDVAFEVSGSAITKHPSLATLAQDDLCRYLFQLVRSDTMPILQESLRVTGTLLATSRSGLKLQQELFLAYVVACLHPKVEIPREIGIDPILYEGVPQAPKLTKAATTPSQTGSGRNTPVPVKERQKLGLEGGSRRPDAREAMVECIGALARIPSFMVELYVNYDCDIDRTDLCEDVVGFLSRNAFPDSATWSTTNVPPLCLDALLGYVQYIADRLEDEPVTEGYPDPAVLQQQREKKQLVIAGASKFNDSPKKGIAFLVQNCIISSVDDHVSIAKFLKGTSRVSKKILGEYLTKKDNGPLLDAYLDLFDFRGQRLDEALRDLLGSFRLPGESPLIERLVTMFSEKYFINSQTDVIADKDAVFVFTYAIIMLNTDQHNPTVKTRMALPDFTKNLRGVNGGKDFPSELLETIFETIRTNEIILPEEHDNQHAFDYAWKELLIKTQGAGDLVLCDTNVFDAPMFAATWKPIVATLSYVFMSATDDAVFTRVITGFDQVAKIAAKYKLHECLDRVIRCLSLISTLATESPPSTKLNTEVQVNDNSVMVSEMAVRFGRDFKAQLATVVLFRIITGKEAVIREGWNQVVRIWLNLFVNSLIPPFFLPDQNSLDLPPIPLRNPSHVIERRNVSKDAGLFSTLSNYLSSYAADDPPEPSDEELESTLCTVDCVNSCFLGDIFSNIVGMDEASTVALMKALLSTLPEESSPVVIIKHELPVMPQNGPAIPERKDLIYDPAVLYVTELATCLALRAPETVQKLGPDVAVALQNIIRGAKQAHPLVVARCIYYLLSILKAGYEHEFLRAPIILHSIATLEKPLLDKCAGPIVKGIRGCIDSTTPLMSEIVNSPDFWSLLRMLATNSEVSGDVFDILELVAIQNPLNVTADNYVAVVTVLNDFATAGSIGAKFEQLQDRVKKGKITKVSERPDADVVIRGTKAALGIYNLTTRVPALITKSHLEQTEAWTTYWSPIFQALSTQCINPCREIRHNAFSSLQRALLSPELASTDHKEWTGIFGDVMFPLITMLLKPEVYQSDPRGMSETRVQAATLLCKIFLHYLVLLSEWEGMLGLWSKILDIMDRLMNSGQSDHLEEAVPESLKNVLLVMSNSGFLVPPDQQEEGNEKQKELWEQTWKRLERFLPDLYKELYPDAAPAAKPAEAETS
ncbi:GDP/GTP exchange factor for ARF [Orbilia brochopaga]|uniref:GDP/GTP exchange factor for ARF n=1 Tax=Orbilia brochopaga TaxID=3140254 RepID=A0AAV9TZY5_9PEZI